jgi:integrase
VGFLWAFAIKDHMALKLTKRTIEALRTDERTALFFDDDLTGFGVRITAQGSKQFVVQYRMPGGRRATKRRLTIGRYGSITVNEARTEARRLFALVAQGRDPAEEQTRRKKAPTLSELAPAFLDMIDAKRKATTGAEYHRMMTRHVLPAIGSKRVADVTRAQVSTLHLSLRKTPYQANRVLALVGTFFEWAERQDYRPEHCNPTRHVEPYPERKRDRSLSPEEFLSLGRVLARADREGLPSAPARRRKPPSKRTAKHRPKSADKPMPANPLAVALIRFLLFSGWREGEARTLRWDALDTTRGFAILTDTKTGRSVRQLGASALALVAELPRIEGSPYVFPGTKDGQPIKDVARLWDAVRHAAGMTDLRIHDLRHAFASVAASGSKWQQLAGCHFRSSAVCSDTARRALPNVTRILQQTQ